MKASQVAEKINLENDFCPKRARPLRNRKNLIKPGAIVQQLGGLIPCRHHDPCLRIIFPQSPDAGNGKYYVANIAKLNQQNTARRSYYRGLACN
ncbi:MAG: hypothetical protein WC256_03775 [Desulfurivibrionaceae bacterium]